MSILIGVLFSAGCLAALVLGATLQQLLLAALALLLAVLAGLTRGKREK